MASFMEVRIATEHSQMGLWCEWPLRQDTVITYYEYMMVLWDRGCSRQCNRAMMATVGSPFRFPMQSSFSSSCRLLVSEKSDMESCSMSNASNMGVNDSPNALERLERKEKALEPLQGHSHATEIMEELETLFRETESLREGNAAVAISREKELRNNKAIRNHAKQLKHCSEV